MRTNISLRAKFGLVSLAYTLPIVTLIYFMVREKEVAIEFARQELSGNKVVESANSLLTTMSQLAVLYGTATQFPNRDEFAQIPSLEAEAEETLGKLVSLQRSHGKSLLLTDESLEAKNRPESSPQKIADSWKMVTSNSEADKKLRHLRIMMGHIKELTHHVGDSSNLILDPELDSFYLMDALVIALPSMIDNVYIRFESQRDHPSMDKPNKLITNTATPSEGLEFDREFQRLISSTKTSVNENATSTMPNKDWQDRLNRAVHGLQTAARNLTDGPSNKYETKDTVPASLEFLKATNETLKDLHGSLQHLLEARISRIQWERLEAMSWVGLSWLLAGWLAYLLQRSVTSGALKVFSRLKIVAEEIRASSHLLSNSAQKSAATSSQEAAAIQESVAAMAEMTSMISQTALHTDTANGLAADAMAFSQSGRETMRSMAAAMSEISESNNKLSDITRIINDIASRTNVINDIVFKTQLLAVNASIEAARAGHHGKGFSVVANEVANLASLSGKAAAEIRQLLDESKSHVAIIIDKTAQRVSEGQTVSANAMDGFEHVLLSVTAIAEKVKQVFDATKEQEIGVQQSSIAMRELNIAATSNNGQAQENAALGLEIKRQAAALESIERAMSFVVFGEGENRTEDGNRDVNERQDESSRSGENYESENLDHGISGRTKNVNSDETGKDSLISAERSQKSLSQSRKSMLATRISERIALRKKPIASEKHSLKRGRFAWEDSYDIGVEPMNDHHKKLLELMTELESAYRKGVPIEQQVSILGELKDYTVYHFSKEESYLDSIRFPELEAHKRIHKNLLAQLERHVESAVSDSQISPEIFGFLKTWLSAHIQGVDSRYGKFTKSIAA